MIMCSSHQAMITAGAVISVTRPRPSNPHSCGLGEASQAVRGSVVVHPDAATAEQNGPAEAAADRLVDGLAGGWWQRNQDDLAYPTPQSPGNPHQARHDGARPRHLQGSGQGRSGWPEKKLFAEPSSMSEWSASHLHGPAAGPGVPECVPGRQQVWMFFAEFVFEPAEGSLALDSPGQPAPGALIGDCGGEVGHVLVPDPGRQRLDEDQVQFVEVDGCLPVDAGVSRPERDLSCVRVDQPVVFVIGLAGQCAGDLFQIEAAQVKHQARINLPRNLRSSTGTPDQRQMRTTSP
jgi:hypothetical protein